MEPAALIAFAVTAVLGIGAALCALIGVALWSNGRTRPLAPLITFIPTLATLGAAGGSWGLACLVATGGGPGTSDRPVFAWLIGLPVGGVLGGLLGLWLALSFRRRATGAPNPTGL